jgi:hypothetical protein
MPWTKGIVTEEVWVDLRYYKLAIQLLEYEGSEKALRFCVSRPSVFASPNVNRWREYELVINRSSWEREDQEDAKETGSVTLRKNIRNDKSTPDKTIHIHVREWYRPLQLCRLFLWQDLHSCWPGSLLWSDTKNSFNHASSSLESSACALIRGEFLYMRPEGPASIICYEEKSTGMKKRETWWMILFRYLWRETWSDQDLVN